MSKNRTKKNKVVKHTEIDIALLSCGLVDIDVFKDCVSAIAREQSGQESKFYLYLNGADKESKQAFLDVANEFGAIVKQSSDRLGFPAAANKVIKQGSAPLVLFITDDIILHEGALQKLIDRVRSEKEIGLCGMKLIFPEDSTDPARPAGRVQHIGHAIDIRGEITHPLIGWSPENPKCNKSREVLSVTGGVFLAKRKAFHQAGGFWEGYGMGYFEDVDLNLTLRENGWKIWVDTEAVATHYTNASMSQVQVPPLSQNKMIFRARKGGQLVNDSWLFW